MNSMISFARVAAVAGVGLTLGACSTAKVVSDVDMSPGVKARPAVIYVEDFDVGGGAVQSQSMFAHLPLHAWREQSQAHDLVASMQEDVAKDLASKGLVVRRLTEGSPLPADGWLVRGTILQLDEGNRLRRAVIGFGTGQTQVQVAVAIDDLGAHQPVAPLFEMQTDAKSGRAPGAVITLNPYVAAAKFVLSGHDLKQNVQKTAVQIADRVVAHVHNATPPATSS